ncbi:MAG TPA: ABC transporter substrate-binding protein [Cyclobacteriaceae bacterium]|nr:ABC transporter substrate-binding protein [Cyclobacteriaceae bacterium]
MQKTLFSILFLCFAGACFGQSVRIITAGSAMTETVCALGDCGKIVATDKTSLYPAEVTSLPSIGYRSGINAEGIIALKPTLFIVERKYVDDAVVQQIQSTGIKVIEVPRAYDLAGTKELIRMISKALNKTSQGEQILAKIESQLAEASVIIKKAKTSPKVLCIYNRGTSSFDVAGNNTFSNILPLVNATPAVTGVDGYKPLNTEALIASNPDFLLMFESGVKSLGGVDGVLNVTGVNQTTAGKKKQVIAMDGSKLSNFGPRLGEAVKELAESLYPNTQAN